MTGCSGREQCRHRRRNGRKNLKVIEIKDFTLAELKPYTCKSEVQLLRYFEPKPGIFIAESPKVISRALDAGYEPISLLVEKERITTKAVQDIMEWCGNVPIYTADIDLLTQITGFHLTQGVLCAMKRYKLPDWEAVCSKAMRIAVLEDVMNPTNIGAVFRSAAALDFDALLLTAGCCDPLYRRSVRVSMGTVFQIPWTFFNCSSPEYVEKLKIMGFTVVAMALRDDAVGIDDDRLVEKERLAIVFGTEGEGLRDATINACDHVVKIPMKNGVDSLNVAAASAVAFWQLSRK